MTACHSGIFFCCFNCVSLSKIRNVSIRFSPRNTRNRGLHLDHSDLSDTTVTCCPERSACLMQNLMHESIVRPINDSSDYSNHQSMAAQCLVNSSFCSCSKNRKVLLLVPLPLTSETLSLTPHPRHPFSRNALFPITRNSSSACAQPRSICALLEPFPKLGYVWLNRS